jgi:prepilin-type N-terminal cleavage/methylation domain-containing protein
MHDSAVQSSRPHRSGFTLTELMIVIGIIVLFVTLALPAFNLISGSRSIGGAENIVAALVGRARAEAIGNDTNRGVAFYLDVATNRYYAAIVAAPTFSEWNNATTYSQYQYVTVTPTAVTAPATVPPPIRYFVAMYNAAANVGQNPTIATTFWTECDPYVLDAAADTDIVALPYGVGAEVINNSSMSSTGRASSGYLSMGVLLFGPSGGLSLSRVSLAQSGKIGAAANFNQNIPYYVAPPYSGLLTASTIAGNPNTPNQQKGLPLTGAIGLVLFDKQSFDGQGYGGQISSSLSNTSSYPPAPTAYSSTDSAIDGWLDTNATPLLINRYNGTLIRSE